MDVNTTFYDDGFSAAFNMRGNRDLKKMKSTMSLDLNSGKAKFAKTNGMLASPDLQMLKLASPDLEKLIMIQSNGMVSTTPTLAGTPSQIICPKSVTEEQEAYARGFVDALAELHKKEGPVTEGEEDMGGVSVSAIEVTQPPQASTYATLTTVTMSNATTNASALMTQPQMMTTSTTAGQSLMTSIAPHSNSFNTNISQLPGSVLATLSSNVTTSQMPSSAVLQAPSPHLTGLHSMPVSRTQSPALSITNVPTTVNGEHMMQLKEEPQIVPDLCPINMENQEIIKLDRKRARNRLAARKCRTRKLERISRLEDRVDNLKGQNSDLSRTASALRDQVCKLKEQIMVHVNSGCKVMLSPNLL